MRRPHQDIVFTSPLGQAPILVPSGWDVWLYLVQGVIAQFTCFHRDLYLRDLYRLKRRRLAYHLAEAERVVSVENCPPNYEACCRVCVGHEL